MGMIGDSHAGVEPRRWGLRLVAGISGGTTILASAFAYFLAQQLVRLVDSANGAAQSLQESGAAALASRSGQEAELATIASTWGERLANSWLGGAAGDLREFQSLVVVAGFAGVFALAAASRRRHDQRWPELVWAACALALCAPAFVALYWMVLGVPLGGALLLAAWLHHERRAHFSLRRHLPVHAPAGIAVEEHPAVAAATPTPTADRTRAVAATAASLSANAARGGARLSWRAASAATRASRGALARRAARKETSGPEGP